MTTTQIDQINRLKKDLKLTKERCEDLANELQQKDNQLIQMEAERNALRARQTEGDRKISQLDTVIEMRVAASLEIERKKIQEQEETIAKLQTELKGKEVFIKTLSDQLETRESEVSFLSQKLREVSADYKLGDPAKDIKTFREEKTTELNQLSEHCEKLLAENRYLRELAKVPSDQFGLDLESIKLADRKKVEDYKGLVKILDKQLEDAEEEVARLKHQMRQMTLLYNDAAGGDRYRGLTLEQMQYVDQFVINLKEGRTELPLNDRSRELLKENERLKAQIEILENRNFEGMENFLQRAKPASTTFPEGETDTKVMQALKEQQAELLKQMQEMLANFSAGGGGTQKPAGAGESHPLQWPPVPIPGQFGNFSDVREGYSYRFKSKLNVDMQELYTDQGWDQVTAKYQIACLQLQGMETLELLARREREIESNNAEIEELRNDMRTCLLLQDELFRQYHDEKQSYEKKIKEVEKEKNELIDRNAELENQNNLFEDIVKTLQRNDVDNLKSKLADYAKKISVQEINLIRLARKYECLKDEEQTLREAYHSAEVSYAEKEEDLVSKLNQLAAWKERATTQLKVLFNMQKNSVPEDDYKLVRSKLEVMQEQYADMRVKEANQLKKIAALEINERELFIKTEENKDLKEELLEIEVETEILKKRLEELDPTFKRFQMIFRQIVEVLKSKNVSPLKVFELFDTNRNGKISRIEFEQAMNNMQIFLNKGEMDTVYIYIDVDGSGEIEYREFIRRLRREGVAMRNAEEDLVFQIYEAITNANLTLKQAFEIFDRNGDNLISKNDIKETFSGMRFGVQPEVVDKFFAVADISGDGQINFEEFYHLFERVLKDAMRDEKVKKLDDLDWKVALMVKMDEAIKANNMTLMEAFNIIDANKSGTISFDELKALFEKLGVKLLPTEFRNLFQAIDKSKSEGISYAEFTNYMNECKREYERVRRLQNLVKQQEQLKNAPQVLNTSFDEGDSILRDRSVNDLASRLQYKITLLEQREKKANDRAKLLQGQVKSYQDMLREAETTIRQLEDDNTKLSTEYYKSRERELKFETKLSGTISKEESDRLKGLCDKLLLERAHLKSGLNTFKGLYESSISQVKILKLSLEKRKSEVNTYQETIKSLQMSSEEHALIGKLQHQVMVSRWNEGQTNKKFEELIDEIRALKLEKGNIEAKLGEKEEDLVSTHNAYREKLNVAERSLTDLKLKIVPTLSVAKIDEMGQKVREIAAMKTDLEAYNRRLRETIHEMGIKLDYLETNKQAIEELERKLKNASQDELSDQLIELSKKMSEYKLGELKAKRDVEMYAQKEDYLQRLIRQQTESMKKLEEELSAWDRKMVQREDFWRKRYNDQMQLVFTNKKDGQVGGALGTQTKEGTKYLADMNKKAEDSADMRQQIRILEEKIQEKDKRIEMLEKMVGQAPSDRPKTTGSVSGGQAQGGDQPPYEQMYKDLVKQEENKKFAEAAQKTVKMLQDIIDDKTEQLNRKDEIIKKMREEYIAHKEEDAREIARLNEQLIRGGGAGSKAGLDQSMLRHSQSYDARQIGRMNPSEIENIFAEKDKQFDALTQQLKEETDRRTQVQGKLREALARLNDLERDYRDDKEKKEPNRLQKEIDFLKRDNKDKEKEIKALKKSIEAVKAEYLKISGQAADKEIEMQKKLQKTTTDQDLQVNMALKRIQELDKKTKELTKELEEVRLSELQLKGENTTLKEEIEKQKQANESHRLMLKDAQSALGKSQRDLKDMKSSGVNKKVEDFFQEAKSEEAKALEEKIKNLEAENALLKTEKPHADLFDKAGTLTKPHAFGFENSADIATHMGMWISVNPSIRLFPALKRYDKTNSGFITQDDLMNVLESVGLKLKPEDRKKFLEGLKKNTEGRVDYVAVYNLIKGIQDEEITAKAGETQITFNQSVRGESAVTRKELMMPSEREKTLQKNIDLLKTQVAELKKDNDTLQKQLNDWKLNYDKLKQEHNILVNKPISKLAGGSIDTRSYGTGQKESIQDLKDKVFQLETKNQALERSLFGEKDAVIKKLGEDKRKLEEEVKNLKNENAKTRTQLDYFFTKKMSTEQLKEEIETDKDVIISNLKEKLNALRDREKAQTEKIFELEQQLLDLKFIKEHHDVEVDRLNRRIQELDEFKETIKKAPMHREPEPRPSSAQKKPVFKK